MTDATAQTRTYNYNTAHRLTSVTQNGNTLFSITPDAVGRPGSVTNSNGYTLSYTYDGLNRLLRVIYPDGSYIENDWGCCHLDAQRDRAGYLTWFDYNEVNRLILTVDPQNRITEYVYDPAGNLTKLIDPNRNATQWQYDNRNRVAKKTYPDGSSYVYDYDGVGNLLLGCRVDQHDHRIPAPHVEADELGACRHDYRQGAGRERHRRQVRRSI